MVFAGDDFVELKLASRVNYSHCISGSWYVAICTKFYDLAYFLLQQNACLQCLFGGCVDVVGVVWSSGLKIFFRRTYNSNNCTVSAHTEKEKWENYLALLKGFNKQPKVNV